MEFGLIGGEKDKMKVAINISSKAASIATASIAAGLHCRPITRAAYAHSRIRPAVFHDYASKLYKFTTDTDIDIFQGPAKSLFGPRSVETWAVFTLNSGLVLNNSSMVSLRDEAVFMLGTWSTKSKLP